MSIDVERIKLTVDTIAYLKIQAQQAWGKGDYREYWTFVSSMNQLERSLLDACNRLFIKG